MNSEYKISRTSYFIEILGGKYLKEKISLRLASVNLICYECKLEIKKGEKYIRDKFWFRDDTYETEWKKLSKVNNICLICWRGQVPKLISTNWKKNKNGI